MPTDEKLHTAGDPLDRSPEIVRTMFSGGLAGTFLGALNGVSGDQPLGVDPSVGAPTGVGAADHTGAGAGIDVSYTKTNSQNVEIVVTLQNDSKCVKKVDSTSSPENVTGLTDGVAYDVWVRSRTSDGRVGPFATKATVTPSAS